MYKLLRRSKYRNIRTKVGGINFASKKEAERYLLLKHYEKCGLITQLKLQPRFKLSVAGKDICTYVADFSYFAKGVSFPVVEDVKGFKTEVYKLKKALFLALYPECSFNEV